MKKVYRILTIFSLFILLIIGLTFFSVKQSNSLISMNDKIAGDTDGITNTELSNLYVKDFEGMFTFSSTTYEYTLPLYSNTIRFEIVATAKDADAKITIEGNEYLTAQTGSATITVSNGIASNTVYTINWNRTLQTYVDSPYNKTAAGEATYSVPATGYYKLEVWGAQGGTTNGYAGGYGGYSVGVVKVNKGTNLYVNVGGQGSTYNPTGSRNVGGRAAGGHNGGGYGYGANCNGDYRYAGGGGGATHVALSSGVISSFNSNRGKLLIVAGGGGGGHYIAAAYGAGAHGGGSVGNTSTWRNTSHRYYVQPTGGTQTGGGSNGYSYSGYAGSTA
jgi:hypothetical protein